MSTKLGTLWQKKQIDLTTEFGLGVLSRKQIVQLQELEILTESRIEPGPSSIDLSIAPGECWKLNRGVIKPRKEAAYTEVLCNSALAVPEHLENGSRKRIEPHETYVFKVAERLRLDAPLYAHATGKSSIGRLDVLARLIADEQPKYDQIDPPFDGDLYVEMTPLTFPITVQAGDAACQLRFFKGPPSASRIHKADLDRYSTPVLNPEDPDELRVTVKPDDSAGCSAYVASQRQHEPIAIGGPAGALDPRDYWERVQKLGNGIAIETNRFYILRSVERFRLPKNIAVYAEAMHESLGEMRIHYAGFVHPHFGAGRLDGTPLIFEVRGHDVRVYLREGEVLAKLQYFRMSAPAEDSEPAYEDQELKLAKHFAEWRD